MKLERPEYSAARLVEAPGEEERALERGRAACGVLAAPLRCAFLPEGNKELKIFEQEVGIMN